MIDVYARELSTGNLKDSVGRWPFMGEGSNSDSITREFTVKNKLGIHARPAAMFVKVANQFDADVFVEKDGERINGKSIMGLMMLAAGPGSVLSVEASGGDAEDALGKIGELIDRNFDEE